MRALAVLAVVAVAASLAAGQSTPTPATAVPGAVRTKYAGWESDRLFQHSAFNRYENNLGDSHRLNGNPRTAGPKFVATILGSGTNVNQTYTAGMEVRLLVATAWVHHSLHFQKPVLTPQQVSQMLNGSYSLLPAFNFTGPSPVRVRVIAAGPNRNTGNHHSALNGFSSVIACNEGESHDVWAEFWSVAPRSLAWGRHMVFSGYATFTVPPFDFRVCIKDVSQRNATKAGRVSDLGLQKHWAEFVNLGGVFFPYAEPVLLWRPSTSVSTHYAGDYAGIEIVANKPPHHPTMINSRAVFNASAFSLGDSVKLVPTGYPCTYERATSRRSLRADTTRTDQYCGTNAVHAVTGEWLGSTGCEIEGSVAEGVARAGTREVNPWASDSFPSSIITSAWNPQSELVAYLKLPAAGNYDICVSTRAYRRAAHAWANTTMGHDQPVWIKAYDAASSSCTGVVKGQPVHQAACKPRKTVFTTTASVDQINWYLDDATPESWAAIKFNSTLTLDYTPATAWDHSSPRDYFNLAGGDMFRIVPDAAFNAVPAASAGYLGGTTTITVRSGPTGDWTLPVTRASTTYTTGVLSTAGEGAWKQYELAMPMSGSKGHVASQSGCFWGGSDNFGAGGLNGNPGTQCCSSAPCSTSGFCSMTDSGANGPTASADLGADPRSSTTAHASDSTGTSAWGYIRVPRGTFRVCYRQAGGNWRVIGGVSPNGWHTTNKTVAFKAHNRGYEFRMPDNRAETWGPVNVTARDGAVLTREAWNYYSAPTATAVGSAFKIVKTTENCWTSTAQTRTYNTNPGGTEWTPTWAQMGSADDSSTAVSWVTFYALMPVYSSSDSFRVCFRDKAGNWLALANNMTYNSFMVRDHPAITMNLLDNTEGSWAKMLFNRTVTSTMGCVPGWHKDDLVRIVVNATSAGTRTACDITYNPAATDLKGTAQVMNAATQTMALGVGCAVESGVSTDTCYTNVLKPTDNSIVGTKPYTNLVPAALVTEADVAQISNLDATLAFLTLPARVHATSGNQLSYAVCYKHKGYANWNEVKWEQAGGAGILTIKAARTIAFTSSSNAGDGSKVIAGSYTYIGLTGTAATPITWQYDLVKLVGWTQTCEATSVENAGYYKYSSFAGASSTAVVVDATSVVSTAGTSGNSATGRAYVTIPTKTGTAAMDTMYRVCYMARTSDVETQNWHDLSTAGGALTAKYLGAVYTVTNKPYVYGMLGIKFISGGVLLNTNPNMDAAKVVSSSAPCLDQTATTTQPSVVTGLSGATHQGQEVGASSANGVTDMGVSDSFPVGESRIEVVLGSGSFKVCLKPAATGVWMEVTQALGGDRVYALPVTDSVITPTSNEVSKFTVQATLTNKFTDQPNYFGNAWGATVSGGASTHDGTTALFTITYASAQAASLSHTVKFVKSYVEQPAGTYTRVADANCFSPGFTVAYTTAASSTQDIKFNMPNDAGKYTVCVWVAASSTWYQAPADTTVTGVTVGQPMIVTDSMLTFEAISTTGLRVFDNRWTNGTSYAALAQPDTVYIINSTAGSGACGNDVSYNDIVAASAAQPLNGSLHGDDTTNFLAVRTAVISLPASPLTGAYTVCYFRSQDAATNNSITGSVLRGNWYQLRNMGSTYGGPGIDYLAVTNPTQLKISGCPVFNSTFRLRTGRFFDVTVEAADANGNRVPYTDGSVKRYDVSATAVTSFALQSDEGECRPANAAMYGYTSAALTQWLTDGQARFRLTALSSCPGGVCTYNFATTTASSISAASTSCSFNVQPTTVAAVEIVTSAFTCEVGAECAVSIVARHSDGGQAHTINSGLTVTASGLAGLAASGKVASSGAGISVAGGSGPVFTNGRLDLVITFTPDTYSTATSTVVSVVAAANGWTSNTLSITVNRPVLTHVHVVDIYPEGTTGVPTAALVPSWEPVHADLVFGGDDVVLSSSTLTAASGYHLVAGQFYTFVLRAVQTQNSVVSYSSYGKVVPSPYAVTIDGTGLPDIIRGSGCTSEFCRSSLGSTSMAHSVQQSITLRFRNAAGCESGCTLPFKFNGGDPTGAATTVVTPIRAVARKLVVRCATTAAGAMTAAAGSCSGMASTVNKGWYVNVSAVDEYGSRDQYFDGDVIATFSGMSAQRAAAAGIELTTPAALAAGAAATGIVKVTASAGWALLHVTVSKPCPAGVCDLQLMSTWGTNVASAGYLVATKNTASLKCTLNKVLAYCDVDATTGACTNVGGVSLWNTTHADSLIYHDTEICADIEAVDANGDNTLYETNWVMYYAADQAATPASMTVTDSAGNTDFVQRYKPMKNSKVSFCFKVSGAFTDKKSFKVHFVAQRFRDQGYWAQGATGTCALGAMSLWPQKRVAAVSIDSVTGGDASLVGTSTTTKYVAASKPSVSTDLQLTWGISLKDHYGNAIDGANLMPTETSKYVEFLMSSGKIAVTVAGHVGVRGDTNVTLAASATQAGNVTGAVSYVTDIDGACLGCWVYVRLMDTGSAAVIHTLTSSATTPTAGAVLYVRDTDATSTKHLGFNPSTSPLRSKWVNGTANLAATTNSGPTYHTTHCVGTHCAPFPTVFNLARCDARGSATALMDELSGSLKMRVYQVQATGTLSTEAEPQDMYSQVDIFNTYTVAVSVGNQLLNCDKTSGAMCMNDNSASVSQTIDAYGATLVDAVDAFKGVSDASIKATSFYLTGLTTSAYLEVNETTSKLNENMIPGINGAFAAAATTTTAGVSVTGISSPAGHAFYWRPQAQAVEIVVKATALDADPCNDTTTYDCYGGASCSSPGFAQMGSVSTDLAFAYASQSIPTGVAFPVTIEAVDASGARVVGASGAVTITVDKWEGCNNGGAPTFTGTMANGRMTKWLTFSTPCEKCTLKFVVAAASSEFAVMNANPSSLAAWSSPVTITSVQSAATHVVTTAATPASVLTASSTTARTIAEAVSVTVATRAVVGRIPYAVSNTKANFAVYNKVQTPTGGLWWTGNGGALRAALTAAVGPHHAIASTNFMGSTTHSFYFTRTCSACKIRAAYTLAGGSRVLFEYPTTFVVATAASQKTPVGFVPRTVMRNQDMAVSFWTTGSEDASIPVAGVALPATTTTAATASFSVTASTNGDGGAMTTTAFTPSNGTEIHRVSFSQTCSECALTIGGNAMRVRVLTTATHLQPEVSLTAVEQAMPLAKRPAMMKAIDEYSTMNLRALDDTGFVGERFGWTGCTWPEDSFTCASSSPGIGFWNSADGMTPNNFPQNNNNDMLFAVTSAPQTSWPSYMRFGAGSANFTFTEPVRNVVPIFYSSGLTSATTASRMFPVPKFSVSTGKFGLTAKAVALTQIDQLSVNIPASFDVALTGMQTSTTKNYVAVEADNYVSMHFSAGCPAYTGNTTAWLMAGYAKFTVTFTAAVALADNCAITFHVGSGNGTCGSAAQCNATLSGVVVAPVTVKQWVALRPSVWDNGVGSTTGMMYAAAGRRSYLEVQLLADTANGATIPYTECPTCTLAVTGASNGCGLVADASAQFGTSSKAGVTLQWADNGAATYSCSIAVTVTGADGTTKYPGPDAVSTTVTYTVSVCKPASVALMTNTSDVYRGVMLSTGVGYEFYAVMKTAAGAQCWGDSQDDATMLSIAAVDAAGAAVPMMEAVNLNSTDVTAEGYANGNWMSTAMARTTVQAVGGAFKFLVAFTNSTANLGLTAGIRVKITATSTTPALSSTVTSTAVHTVITGAALRFHPMYHMPMHVVTGRRMVTGPMAMTKVAVNALDALHPAWFAAGIISGMPNVAKMPMEYGNNADVFWKVQPPPATASFPLAFTGGSQQDSLAMGAKMWDSVTWNGPDGFFNVAVDTTTANIAATPAHAFQAQAATGIRMLTKGFTDTAPATCAANCDLPNGTFTETVNATINGNTPFWSIPSLKVVEVPVAITDANNMPVLGDNVSVVALDLNTNNAVASLVVAAPPTLDMRGTLYARVENGVARFRFAFLGSTLTANGVEMLSTMSFSCPATRPAEHVRPGESATNPCFGLTAATTTSFQVTDTRARLLELLAGAQNEILAARTIVQLTMSFTNAGSFNQTLFRSVLLDELNMRGIDYLSRANIRRVAILVACSVEADFVDLDLGTSVCTGNPRGCDAGNGNQNCPNFVASCVCPQAAARANSRTWLSRFLLQNTSSMNILNGSKTVSELDFDLLRADGFPATNVAEAVAEYEKLFAATMAALQSPSMAAFQITGIRSRAANAAIVTGTTPPQPSSPGGNGTAPPPQTTTSATSVAAAVALVLGALLALLA